MVVDKHKIKKELKLIIYIRSKKGAWKNNTFHCYNNNKKRIKTFTIINIILYYLKSRIQYNQTVCKKQIILCEWLHLLVGVLLVMGMVVEWCLCVIFAKTTQLRWDRCIKGMDRESSYETRYLICTIEVRYHNLTVRKGTPIMPSVIHWYIWSKASTNNRKHIIAQNKRYLIKNINNKRHYLAICLTFSTC